MAENRPDGSDPVAAVDELLDRLASLLSGAGGDGAVTTGTAEDDGIVVTLGPDGRVRDIEIDPRLLRHQDSIAPGIVSALNQAAHARPEGGGSRSTVAELQQIQEDSLVVTQQLNASLLDSVARMSRRD